MIIVKLVGGLGNQMFEYAAGRRLAHANGTQLKLDTTYLLDRRPRPNVIFRDFDLPIFNINAEMATPDEVARFTGRYDTRMKVYWHKLIAQLQKPQIIREKDFSFDESLLQEKDNSYLVGYWQSEKYFKDIESIIRKEFTFKNDLLEQSLDLKNTILSTNAVCINVRRTDFVNLSSSSQTLGFVGKLYYEQAIQLVEEQISDPHFFIFSDDLLWCKENIRLKHATTYVEHVHAGEKFQNYLHLMTLCKHYIIPNSTFAWWAVWMNKSVDKLVIAPKQWFADGRNDQDLVLPQWIRL